MNVFAIHSVLNSVCSEQTNESEWFIENHVWRRQKKRNSTTDWLRLRHFHIIIMNYHWIPIHTHTPEKERQKHFTWRTFRISLRWEMDVDWGCREQTRCSTFISNINVFCQLELQCPSPCHTYTHSRTQILFTATEDPLVIVSRVARLQWNQMSDKMARLFIVIYLCIYTFL